MEEESTNRRPDGEPLAAGPLVCDAILGNVARGRLAPPSEEQDVVGLKWQDCPRRALRRTTRNGREITIFQPPGQVIRQGDILFECPALRVCVEIIPAEVMVARPASPRELALLAFEIGNLHAPAEITEHEIRVAPDGPLEELFERLKVPWVVQVRRFQPCFTAGGVTLAPGVRVVRRQPAAAPAD